MKANVIVKDSFYTYRKKKKKKKGRQGGWSARRARGGRVSRRVPEGRNRKPGALMIRVNPSRRVAERTRKQVQWVKTVAILDRKERQTSRGG